MIYGRGAPDDGSVCILHRSRPLRPSSVSLTRASSPGGEAFSAYCTPHRSEGAPKKLRCSHPNLKFSLVKHCLFCGTIGKNPPQRRQMHRALSRQISHDPGAKSVPCQKEMGRKRLLRHANGKPKYYLSTDKDHFAGHQCSQCPAGRYSGGSQYARCVALSSWESEGTPCLFLSDSLRQTSFTSVHFM